MTIAIADVLASTDELLLDAKRVRWPVAERIRWANEAMGAILIRRPQAFPAHETHALVAGTKQTIPAGGTKLLDVVRNTNGRAIRRTDRQLLDDLDPDWHKAKPKAVIRHFTHDDRDPKTFYVEPPAIAGTQVDLVHAKLPDPVAENDESGQLQIGREYTEAVVNYVCYRCNSKDSEFAQGAVAVNFFQAFEAALGVQAQAEIAASPNQPGNSV